MALASSALVVRADTSNVSANGFTSSFREEIQAGPDEARKAIVQLPGCWSDRHTWSGQASNMTRRARPSCA